MIHIPTKILASSKKYWVPLEEDKGGHGQGLTSLCDAQPWTALPVVQGVTAAAAAAAAVSLGVS